MKQHKQNLHDFLNESFAEARNVPSGQVQEACDRVMDRLSGEREKVAVISVRPAPVRAGWLLPRWAMGIAAALIAVVSLFVMRELMTPVSAYAVVETVDGRLYRVSDNETDLLAPKETIRAGERIRSKGPAGSVLALTDGSHIEMRTSSELVMERATDGVHVRLNSGSVIINASSRPVYVETKDVTVSLAGTVSLVSAEEPGSRVTVIQGEARLQQGEASRKMLPGDQMATNPLMELMPLAEEFSWSRNVLTHMALLEQTAPARASQRSAPPRLEFEVASLKPDRSDPGPALMAGLTGAGRPGLVECRGSDGGMTFGVVGMRFETVAPGVPQGRCIGNHLSLRTLIAVAYDVSTIPSDRITGGEDWPDMYQLEAKAENPTTVTKDQLQQMLQTLVLERFKLKIHREAKDTQGCVLSVGRGGPRFMETTGDEDPPRGMQLGPNGELLLKGKLRMKSLARQISAMVGSLPVLDKTELSGLYDITMTLHRTGTPPRGGGARGAGGGARMDPFIMEFDPPLAKVLDQQLGLQLDCKKVPVEFITVDRVEKPSEN